MRWLHLTTLLGTLTYVLCEANEPRNLQARKKIFQQYLTLVAGLKSLLIVALVKVKIVLIVAIIAGLVAVAWKYLTMLHIAKDPSYHVWHEATFDPGQHEPPLIWTRQGENKAPQNWWRPQEYF